MSFSHVTADGLPIDLILNSYINKDNGFFIELGANNGLRQSNTAFLEFKRNWKGILIEPSVSGYNSCIVNRPNSTSYNCCCVSNEYTSDEIQGDFNGALMSSVGGHRLRDYNLVSVSARTLESILDEYFTTHEVTSIDLLSLDTEGYEYSILQGLNLNKYRPRYMIIEIYSWDLEKITSYLTAHNYSFVENISNYTKENSPRWDGTHNDYIFVDSTVTK